MALKCRYGSKKELPGQHAGLYAERDGAWVLDVEGVADKTKLDEFRNNNTALLKHCQRIKVVRLCVLWAEELNLSWAEAARKAAGRKIGRSRWTSQLKDGTTLILKT
jgi:hypothetical protein